MLDYLDRSGFALARASLTCAALLWGGCDLEDSLASGDDAGGSLNGGSASQASTGAAATQDAGAAATEQDGGASTTTGQDGGPSGAGEDDPDLAGPDGGSPQLACDTVETVPSCSGLDLGVSWDVVGCPVQFCVDTPVCITVDEALVADISGDSKILAVEVPEGPTDPLYTQTRVSVRFQETSYDPPLDEETLLAQFREAHIITWLTDGVMVKAEGSVSADELRYFEYDGDRLRLGFEVTLDELVFQSIVGPARLEPRLTCLTGEPCKCAYSDFQGVRLAVDASFEVTWPGHPNDDPLTVDLADYAGSQQELSMDDPSHVGSAVREMAMDGDGSTLVVADPNTRPLPTGSTEDPHLVGVVHVLTRGNDGRFGPPQVLTESDPGDNHMFGRAVALSDDGTTLAVAARFPDSDPETGVVYVFRRVQNSWEQEARFETSELPAHARPADSLALSPDGSVLAVGLPNDDRAAPGGSAPLTDSLRSSGTVELFARSGGSWHAEGTLRSSQIQENGDFGESIAFSGDGNILAVGAPGEAVWQDGEVVYERTGAVQLFERGAGDFEARAYLQPASAVSNSTFGQAVSLSGDGHVVVAGAAGNRDSDAPGFVTIFSGADWAEQTTLQGWNARRVDEFGASVGLSADGSTLTVASSGLKEGDERRGAVYVFEQSDQAWTPHAALRPQVSTRYLGFGDPMVVSRDGRVLAARARLQPPDEDFFTGEPVFVFTRQ